MQMCYQKMQVRSDYSYIGSELTYPIYFEGTIGAAKKHLHQTADEITKEVGVKALISVNKDW